jgi:N-acetylglutamate synthase-like GNAT family acetyltransferase
MDRSRGFSEKGFYLAEFAGRALAIAVSSLEGDEFDALELVLAELEANATRVVLLSPDPALLERVTGEVPLSTSDPRWVGSLWRGLRRRGRMAIAAEPGEEFAGACREIALRLRLAKLVWIDPQGWLARPDGERLSFADLAQCELLLETESSRGGEGSARLQLLREIRTMVTAGIPSVNFCSLAGLADELFTYAGSGTFFTRDSYADVRWLALDEYDAAYHLIQRGVSEGYLVERCEEELEQVLGRAFGVFVQGRYLAGIGALLTHGCDRAGEIVSLYTLTRFLGEGVGAHLVNFAVEIARSSDLAYLFACTTSERVEGFFERCGFRRVDPSRVPAEKWGGYAPERRERVRCLRREISGPGPGEGSTEGPPV